MPLRSKFRSRVAAALAAAVLGLPAAALAAPADDLKEAQRLYNQGKVPAAMDKVDGFLRAQPKDAQGRFLKGLLLTEQKRTAEAIQVFTALTEDFPELPEPYNNLAVLYASQGNYEKAKSALELAIHTHPSYATAHENLGDIYAQLASRAYDRALQLDKNNTTAQTKLALVKDLFVGQRAAPKGTPVKADAPRTQPVPPEPRIESKPVTKAPEPTRVASGKVEPTKPEPKAAPAKTEPAKTESAKTESAKAAPAKTEPAKTEPAKTEPAKAAPAAGAGDQAAIAAAIEAWAKAWSAKDVKGYLGAYAPEFEVPGGEKRAAWEKQRTERIERPKSIEVNVKINSVQVSGNEATVSLRQSYKSDTLKANSTKTLKMVRSGDRWLIKQERSGG